jgi:RimJ/RimL family protein N-acetyltransferase
MIQLEKFSRAHYNDLIAWIQTAEDLMQFAGPSYIFPLTKEQLDHSLMDENRYAFSVILSGKVIGYCELYTKEQSIHLGRILIGNKNLRGKGIGTQIVNELLHFGFNNFDKPIAELNVFDWNISAIACYKKVGFQLNNEKKIERRINNEVWLALNMCIDKVQWLKNQQRK